MSCTLKPSQTVAVITCISRHFCLIISQDIDFFQHLEMHLRAEQPSLCGRDHLSYRSYYMPVKVCILISQSYLLLTTSYTETGVKWKVCIRNILY